MKREKCGHKAGPDCIICNDPSDTEMSQHLSLVFKLIDLAPTLIAMQLTNAQEAATNMFTEALGYPGGVAPDAGIVNRLSKLVITATNTAAQMIRLVDTRATITLDPVPPQWTSEHLLAARMVVAAANDDPSMVADLLVAGLAGKDPEPQVIVLSNVLYLQIMAAWKARQIAVLKAKAANT